MLKKEDLKKYAKALMFEMNDNEYDTLLEEFDTLLKQMDIIASFEGIEDVRPLSFPFLLSGANLRSDEVENLITSDEVVANCKDVKDESVRLPKVVTDNE